MGRFGVSACLAVPGVAGLTAILGVLTVVIGIGDLVFAYGAWDLMPRGNMAMALGAVPTRRGR